MRSPSACCAPGAALRHAPILRSDAWADLTTGRLQACAHEARQGLWRTAPAERGDARARPVSQAAALTVAANGGKPGAREVEIGRRARAMQISRRRSAHAA